MMGMHRCFNDDYSAALGEPTYAELAQELQEITEAAQKVSSCFTIKPTLNHGEYSIYWMETTDGTIEALLKLNKLLPKAEATA